MPQVVADGRVPEVPEVALAVALAVSQTTGQWLLDREVRARIAVFGRACVDPVVRGAV